MQKLLLTLLCLVPMLLQAQYEFVVSSYVRGNFYNRGRISDASMQACTDLICPAVSPDMHGNLMPFQYIPQDAHEITTPEALFRAVNAVINRDETTLRLGVTGGKNWKEMIANPYARRLFVQKVYEFLEIYELDGVDLDFEWAETDEEFQQYSETICLLRRIIGNDYILSVSLHPVSYKISADAIEAATFVSLQCYGLSPQRFSFDEYRENIDFVLDYGVPAEKLVPGVPFFAVPLNHWGAATSYYNLVEDKLITSPAQNEVTYQNEPYIFNGQQEIGQKTRYNVNLGLRGIFGWDLADDVPVTNPLSLLQAIVENKPE